MEPCRRGQGAPPSALTDSRRGPIKSQLSGSCWCPRRTHAVQQQCASSIEGEHHLPLTGEGLVMITRRKLLIGGCICIPFAAVRARAGDAAIRSRSLRRLSPKSSVTESPGFEVEATQREHDWTAHYENRDQRQIGL